MDYFFTQLGVVFYLSSFVSTFAIGWFYTDTFLYYSQLFGIFENTRLQYTAFINKNPDKYFPDFLFELGLTSKNKFIKFLCKLVSCPFCLIFWLSLFVSLCVLNIFLTAPIYITSLVITFGTKKLL
jgi:hypothetical protein